MIKERGVAGVRVGSKPGILEWRNRHKECNLRCIPNTRSLLRLVGLRLSP